MCVSCLHAGISCFWYLGSTVPVSSDLAPRITKSVFAFLWNYKKEWLSWSSASLPPSQGGLGVVNIASKLASIQVMWVKSFLDARYHLGSAFLGTSSAVHSSPNHSNACLPSTPLASLQCNDCRSSTNKCWLLGC